MKKYIFLLPLLLLVMSVFGCATVPALNKVRTELDQRIDSKVADLDGKIAALDGRLSALKTEIAAMHEEMGKHAADITALRKSQADTGADIADIRDNLQQLRGQVDSLRKDFAKNGHDYKELKDSITAALNNVVFKVNFIENFLDIGKNGDSEATGDKLKDLSKGKPLSEKEAAYASAYELFKEGKFEKAREAFRNFLKQYPDTEYSANAQFWIGECYYFEKKYENAILEYDKVAKNYPDGNRVPYALLKQGLSFLNLGDKASAKLVLQRVIKEYPNTNQARTAKSKLLTIK